MYFIFFSIPTRAESPDLLPPIIEEVSDGGYGNGNNCFLAIRYRNQGIGAVHFEIERRVAGSPEWIQIAFVKSTNTLHRVEISGDKRGWIRMRSVGPSGTFSDYTPNEMSFCQED